MKVVRFFAAAGFVAAAGCSSVRTSAIATGPQIPPHHGAVALYTLPSETGGGGARTGAREVGVVEVRALEDEATVEMLLPVFLAKVAALGGNAASLDSITTEYPVIASNYTETYSFPCALGSCLGTRLVPTAHELRALVLKGRALLEAGR